MTLVVLAAAGQARAQSLGEARQLYAEGKLTQAIDAYRRAAAALEDSDPEAAGTARNNACVLLTNAGQPSDALPECEAAVRLRRATDDARRLARAHNNLGRALQHLARYTESEASFREALRINRSREDAASETVNWANLGVMATQAGWYSKAIEFQGRALALARRNHETAWAAGQIQLARVNQAVVLERLGAYREALGVYKEVLESGDEIDAGRKAGMIVNRGVVYRNLGDPVRAIEGFEEAIETYRSLGDTAGLSNAYLNIGLVQHLNMANPMEAERAYRQALQLAERSGERSEEIPALYYLGRLLLEAGRADEAEPLFRRSLSASEASGSSEGRWASLEGLGRVARSRGDLHGGLEPTLQAIEEIERVRGSLHESSLRAGYFGERRAVYASAIEILAALEEADPGAGNAERAFDLVHQAKARVLLDALDRETLRAGPESAAAIADWIGDDVLLEYFVGESELFLWVVHAGQIRMNRLGPALPILERIARTYDALSHGRQLEPDSLATLSVALLRKTGPIVQQAEHVRIAPDGLLHYLPFEILATPGGNGEPLIDAVTVSYLPNGAALAWLRHERADSTRKLVGIGDPLIPENSSDEPSPLHLMVERFNLGRLPAAAAELQALDRWMGGNNDIHAGSEATEERLRDLAASGARVVHLVSHTIVDERRGRGAAILLSPGEESDGLLYPHEIAALDYPVDLTVLAACRTALGSAEGGNALATLTGSFLAAGSSAVVATLWDVGDSATRAFMEQFYFELGRGLEPAGALREAKRRMIADPGWNDRTVWAAYVLIGDAGPVAPGRFDRRWLFAVALVAGGLLLWLGFRYGATRKRPGSERAIGAPSSSSASTSQR